MDLSFLHICVICLFSYIDMLDLSQTDNSMSWNFASGNMKKLSVFTFDLVVEHKREPT